MRGLGAPVSRAGPACGPPDKRSRRYAARREHVSSVPGPAAASPPGPRGCPATRLQGQAGGHGSFRRSHVRARPPAANRSCCCSAAGAARPPAAPRPRHLAPGQRPPPPLPARPMARGPRCSPSAPPVSAPGPKCCPHRCSARLPPLAAPRPRGPAANQRAPRRCRRRASHGRLPPRTVPGTRLPAPRAPRVPERPCPARPPPRGLFSGRPFLGASAALGACRPRPKGPGVRWWALPGDQERLCSP